MHESPKYFKSSSRPHILMITNHGVHEWDIIPGLPDTGGQNVFVNQFSEALVKQGYKITIVNRGGYTHPASGDLHTGMRYKDENQRILYLDDGCPKFVRKEDMDEQLPQLTKNLQERLTDEGTSVDLIISHYWDGAKLGVNYNRTLTNPVKHIWVPHSLGAVKKRNVNPDKWENLHIDERIANEHDIIAEIDAVAATSATIRQSLTDDYHWSTTPLFLPPCVNPDRYYPREIGTAHPIWEFLSQHSGLTPEEIRSRKIIAEVSRTDTTKRKDVLIKAFADIQDQHPDTLLVVTIDRTHKPLGSELVDLIEFHGIEKNTAILGSVWDQLPDIYAVTDIYCTPSVMEGFGMSPQEAAATRVPAVSSNLVPYVTEYLLGEDVETLQYQQITPALQVGKGAIVIQADDVPGFARAFDLLLSDEVLRKKMGQSAYEITIPYFTWDHMVSRFLEKIDS